MNIFNFDNQTFTLTNYGTKDNIYFKAIEIAQFLGYADTDQAIRKYVWNSNKTTLDDIHHKLNPVNLTGSKKQHMKTIYITEAGLYQLIFRSKMSYAQQFQKWVLEDVLPSIRKIGRYKVNDNKSVKANLTFNLQNEYDLHTQVINFIKVKYPDILMTVANGELQNDTYEKRQKSFLTGYISGTYDLIIMNSHIRYSGFCIEFKSPTGLGVISDAQKIMELKYQQNNFKTLISNDYNQILYEIIMYMLESRVICIHCKRKFKTMSSLTNHITSFHRL